MRLVHYFIILAALILSLGAILLIVTYSTHPTLFCVAEGLIVLTLILLVIFYRRTLHPLDIIIGGMELLREQDMSTRLAHTGQADTDVIVDTFNNMQQRLRDEHLRLSEQNMFLDLLIKASPMGVVECDIDGNITNTNPAAQRMMTAEVRHQLDVLPVGQSATIRLSDSQIYHITHPTFLDRGHQHPFYLITPLTDEVMDAERAAYGRVIRMIAHEVNNHVASIDGTLGVINTADIDPQAQEAIDACRERTQQMAEFVTRFASVVKMPQPDTLLCDLGEELQATMPTVRALCHHHHIHLDVDISDAATPVNIDTILFSQAITNIVKNAIESIESLGTNHQGHVWIHQEGRTITIADNGRGIDAETARHLFTPFFSTKPDGQGIGLLIVREVLTRHHCHFTLTTDADSITRFVINLPS